MTDRAPAGTPAPAAGGRASRRGAAPATTRRRASRSSRASRPSAAGPACTSARRTRAASTTSSGRSSTTRSTRRWPATPRGSTSGSCPTSTVVVTDDGRGVPVGRHATGQGRPRGRAHRAPRRRQVRRRRLQGLGRPPRRRRQRRQRALRVAAGRVGPGRARLGPGVRARQADDAGRPRSGRRAAAGARERRSGPTRRCSRTPTFSFDTIAQRLRESAYLNKGLWIALVDERGDRERSFYFEGGLVSFVRHLNRHKEVLHAAPDRRREAGRRDDDRGRPPVQRLVHARTSSPSPTTSTRSTAAPTSRASGPRSRARSTTGPGGPASSRRATPT